MRATTVLRTVPAATVSPAAVSHRRSSRATRAQTASAQNRASAYTMDKTIEPGAIAQSATMSRLMRGSAVSFMPSVVTPHAAASPATPVTIRPAAITVTPGSQARESMAAGYPGNQANDEAWASSGPAGPYPWTAMVR
jgi:hypothetical protein